MGEDHGRFMAIIHMHDKGRYHAQTGKGWQVTK
jgi:hypothetical protein